MADLDSFLAHINTVGLPVSSRYFVEFMPSAANLGDSGRHRTVSMLCDQVVIPGVNIMAADIRVYGELTESPYGVTYQPASLSVILDNDSSAKEFFDEWSNDVFDRTTRTLGYYNDFVRDVVVTLTDKEDNPISKIRMIEAYPRTISDMQLDYSSSNIIRLTVSLTFKYWVKEAVIAVPNVEERLRAMARQGDRERAQPASDSYGITTGTNYRDFGSSGSIGASLGQFGPDMGASLGRSMASCSRALVGSSMSGASSLSGNFSSLTSNFVSLGAGLGSLGQTLNVITGPVAAIAGAVSSVSGTLGAFNSTLGALGLGSPFSKIITNLNATTGALSVVSNLNGIPGHISTIGANMTAMGSEFGQVAESIKQVPGATSALSNSLSRLGLNFDRQGTDMGNAASNLNDYAGI